MPVSSHPNPYEKLLLLQGQGAPLAVNFPFAECCFPAYAPLCSAPSLHGTKLSLPPFLSIARVLQLRATTPEPAAISNGRMLT